MAGPGMAGPGRAGPGRARPGMAGPGMAGPGMAAQPVEDLEDFPTSNHSWRIHHIRHARRLVSRNESWTTGEDVPPPVSILALWTPKNRLPKKESLAQLTTTAGNGLFFSNELPDAREFVIFAETPEVVATRARDLITLFDYGLSRTMRLALFEKRANLCESLAADLEELQEIKKSLAELTKSMAAYEGVTPDMADALRLQALQHEVDVAGVKARLAACDKLLERRPALDVGRRQRVEDVQITAEIELAGFQARKVILDELIKKVSTKTEYLERRSELSQTGTRLLHEIDGDQRDIASVDAEIERFAPLPLVDDQITIQPLQWKLPE